MKHRAESQLINEVASINKVATVEPESLFCHRLKLKHCAIFNFGV